MQVESHYYVLNHIILTIVLSYTQFSTDKCRNINLNFTTEDMHTTNYSITNAEKKHIPYLLELKPQPY